MPKVVLHGRKPTHSTQHYLNTLPKTYPTFIHRGEDPSRTLYPILKHEGLQPPLAVLLAYILLRVFILRKVFVQKNFCRNTLTVPKTVTQCRKYRVPYRNTLNRTIHYLNTLTRTIPYLNTLTRTIPYLHTLPKHTLS